MNSNNNFSRGVMLNAYPDSIGTKLSDTVDMLHHPALKDAFSLFYVLPTFFNSDLDRGFSIIDYNINEELVNKADLERLKKLGFSLKFDIVLNHLSVASPQFQDMIKNGESSIYKDFFIDWNEFWKGHGEMNEDGVVIPEQQYLDKLFMRKSGLPILKVVFPDGSERPYWNTFYQKVSLSQITIDDLRELTDLTDHDLQNIVAVVNDAITKGANIQEIGLGPYVPYKEQILKIVNQHRTYLGQMDVNAKSPLVWEYYNEVLAKLNQYGCQVLRLDAFAYLHKEIGQTNFFNKPGTWDYLDRINQIAQANNLSLLPEIHAEYGLHLHDEVAQKGYIFYDFFLPGLLIHAIEKGTKKGLLQWANDIVTQGFQTVNMLGCHDGIPVLDLKGKEVNGVYQPGLLADEDIEFIMDLVISRGGKVKNLYGADGKKISYYQVNATYFSALGEDENKMLLARAIQLFMPGIPQIWYLDLFCGRNDYAAVERAGADGHKEINRTTLTNKDIEKGLKSPIVIKQLELIKLRNTHPAFSGEVTFPSSENDSMLNISWTNENHFVALVADLTNHHFFIRYSQEGSMKMIQS
jgi:sucrose phosphorylase